MSPAADGGRNPGPPPWWTRNGEAVELASIPQVAAADLAPACARLCAAGARLAALTTVPTASGEPVMLVAIADDAGGRLGLLGAPIPPDRAYPALTPALPQAQAFERELHERDGIVPTGHPWLKPLREHAGLASAGRAHDFFRVAGSGVHEVAVGPVHAGIIEPGHFRFQCSGEEVLHLEIQLGYQHRGAEALLVASAPARRLAIAESVAGDTAVGHALAHCGALEGLAGAEVPLPAQIVRGIALELERIANHVGDLGALCNDVGFLPGAAWLGRLRGEFLNLLLELSGNRFGRGLVHPGGLRAGVDAAARDSLLPRLAAAERDLRRVLDVVFESPSVAARFEHAGVLGRAQAEALGLVGPVARASGADRDVRRDHPAGIHRFAHIPVALDESGDVLARARVRAVEALRSLDFVREQLAEIRPGALREALPPCAPSRLALALVEGWRGEILHLATTGPGGEIAGYRIIDPSFRNWFGLAVAMRGNAISDFPLCNKSFNLSYAGHDL